MKCTRPRNTGSRQAGRILLYSFLMFFFLLGMYASPLAAQGKSLKPRIIYPVKQAVSRPVRDMKTPLQPLKVKDAEAARFLGYPQKRGDQALRQPLAPAQDTVLQRSSPVGAMPEASVNFEGLSNIAGYYPPDTCGDVGPNHYVQITNVYFQVFAKSGAPLTAPLANNSLWSGFGGVCESTNDGDPIVLYDQYADRWLLSQFSIEGPFHQCIAISKTGDPTGEWHLYDYEMSTTIMNDYPKFGVWPDGYYMAINQFDSTSGYSWAGQGAVVFDRSAMLSGSPAAMVYFDLESNSALGAMLPTDADGTTAPPAGAPNTFVQFDDDGSGEYPADQLEIYEFHVDWTTPANSTFTESAFSPLAVAPFNILHGTTVPQPDTTQLLDNLGDRLMYRLQYRNFGTHQSMVVNHTVDTTGSGNGIAGIRWYELRDSGEGWAVQQQGTYAGIADSDHRWMGSIAMDSQGNMALGYSVSSASTFPSIRYVGRLAGDPANTLDQGETEIIAGSGSQTGTAARWGDYSMMSVDPADDCTFWYTQEYYQTTSNTGWQTRVAAFKFPGCTAGPAGLLAGTVSDTGESPLAGATVTVDDGGGIQLSTTTGVDGSYGFASLPVGTYTVTAEKFGYTTASVAGISIADGMTTTRDFVLATAPIHTLNGTVTDAAAGWPLYAEVDYGPASVWTDPATGMFAVDLPEGAYSVTAAADHYATGGATLTLDSDRVQDFGLQADATCSAPGYKSAAALAEDFNGCTLPAGWTVTNPGTDCVWVVSNPDPGSDGNLTGGTGCFADADADYCGESTANMNTELISPAVDCSSLSAVTLEFKYDIQTYAETDTFAADISTDGGSTWTNVFQRLGVDDPGPKTALIDITSIAAGQAAVRVRFHYIALAWEYWWQVDDVDIYEDPADKTTCIAPADGGYVVGHIYDDNTGAGLNNALVDDGSGHSVTTVATPDDPNLADGLYSLYLPNSGSQALTASKFGYGPMTEEVNVPLLGTVAHDFTLPAGQLGADPGSIEVHIPLNSTLAADLTLTNSGTFAVDFELLEINAAPPLRPDGPFAVPVRHMSPKHLDDTDAGGARYDYPVPAVPVIAAAGEVIRNWGSGLAYPWGIGHQNDSATLWLGNIAAGGGDDRDYEYGKTGTPTGDSMDVAGAGGASWMADFAYDWLNMTLWQVAVGGDNCIHELDPATLAVTGNSICPPFGTSQRGLAYNPETDTFYAGGWNDSTIHEFDRGGAILRSTNVGLPISGLAFNPVTDHLFVMVSDAAGNPEIYVVEVPASGDFSVAGQFDIPAFTLDDGGAGLAMSCDGHLWAVDQKTQSVYEVDSGETGTCNLDIPWLSAIPGSGTVAAGSSQPVTLNFDSTGYAAGTEEAFLLTQNQSPYGNPIIPVTMIVEPDRLLNVARDGSGSGTVVADSGPVNCGATCTGEYPYNTSVTLTATADPVSTFVGWAGDCSGTGATCTVTMDQAHSVVATFNDPSVPTQDLGVTVAGSGSGGVTSSPAGIFCGTAGTTCSAPFADGASVTLIAAADSGSAFMGWSGDCTGNGACTVTMDQTRSVVATFTNTTATTQNLDVNVTGSGSGGVTSAPAGIFCGTAGSTCGAPFDDGIPVTLTAAAAAGSTFTGWSGDCTGPGLTCDLTMDQDHAASAIFTLQSFALTVSKAGKGDGMVSSGLPGINCGDDCSEGYDYGSQVVLTAEPDSHSALAGWQGSCSEAVTEPPAPTCTVDIQQAIDITVFFDHVFPWPLFLPGISAGGK